MFQKTKNVQLLFIYYSDYTIFSFPFVMILDSAAATAFIAFIANIDYNDKLPQNFPG